MHTNYTNTIFIRIISKFVYSYRYRERWTKVKRERSVSSVTCLAPVNFRRNSPSN